MLAPAMYLSTAVITLGSARLIVFKYCTLAAAEHRETVTRDTRVGDSSDYFSIPRRACH